MKFAEDASIRPFQCLRRPGFLASAISLPVIVASAVALQLPDRHVDPEIAPATHAAASESIRPDRPRTVASLSTFERRPIAFSTGASSWYEEMIPVGSKTDRSDRIDDLGSFRLPLDNRKRNGALPVDSRSFLDAIALGADDFDETRILDGPTPIEPVATLADYPSATRSHMRFASSDETVLVPGSGPVIPEPSTGALVVAGLVLIGSGRRFDR